jgi:hypothetical protein
MFEADKADKAAMSVDTKGAVTAKVNIKSCDIDVATNAAPVKVIKAACSNHEMPIIHIPPAQGTNSARSTRTMPIIHIPVGTGTDGGGGAAAAAPGTASAARTNEKSTKGDAMKQTAKKHMPVIHWGGRSA